MAKHIKLYEDIYDKVDILFLPSGEVLEITMDEFNILNDYVALDYSDEYECYTVDDPHDHLKGVIIMALNQDKRL